MSEFSEMPELLKNFLDANGGMTREEKSDLIRRVGPVKTVDYFLMVCPVVEPEVKALLNEYRPEAEAYLAGIAGMC